MIMPDTAAVLVSVGPVDFSYNIEDAHWMFNRAKELDVPLFAGSSLVVCHRRPFLEHPRGSELQNALIVCGGGEWPLLLCFCTLWNPSMGSCG